MRNLSFAVLLILTTISTAFAQDLRVPSFNYDDIDSFAAAIAKIEAGADPEDAFQTYLNDAAAGLYGWMTRYDITASGFASAYRQYPEFMTYLGSLTPALKAREGEISEDLIQLHKTISDVMDHPTLSILPTYYFVSPMGGGGSAEAIANMIAIDYYGRNPDAPLDEFEERGFWPDGNQLMQSLDALIFVASHEMVHWYQTLLQGELDYIRMYTETGADTLLARAVREGGADFIARLTSDAYTQDQLDYGDVHEQALWTKFRETIYELSDDNPGWFYGRNPHFSDAPWQIGYYVGMRMCEAFYIAAEDKDAAVRLILTAETTAEYETIMQAYDEKWAGIQGPQQ